MQWYYVTLHTHTRMHNSVLNLKHMFCCIFHAMKLLELMLTFDYVIADLLVMLECVTLNGLTFRNIYITYIVMVVMLYTLHKQQLVV
jgi:hypothetical protein